MVIEPGSKLCKKEMRTSVATKVGQGNNEDDLKGNKGVSKGETNTYAKN